MLAMVGQPKTISDLARIDANPVVTCRYCTWRVEYDRSRLIAARLAANLNTDWQMFCAETRCEQCSGPVRVAIKPFVSDTALREGDLKRQLVFKALCVLTEAQHAAKQGRVARTHGLRLALAYLYAVGKRGGEWFDREPYVEFWRVATGDDAHNPGPGHDGAAYGRTTKLQSCMNAIARAAGLELTPDVTVALGRAVSKEEASAR